MFKVNAFTKKGTKIRFRIRSTSIGDVRSKISEIFKNQEMQLVLVELA